MYIYVLSATSHDILLKIFRSYIFAGSSGSRPNCFYNVSHSDFERTDDIRISVYQNIKAHNTAQYFIF